MRNPRLLDRRKWNGPAVAGAAPASSCVSPAPASALLPERPWARALYPALSKSLGSQGAQPLVPPEQRWRPRSKVLAGQWRNFSGPVSLWSRDRGKGEKGRALSRKLALSQVQFALCSEEDFLCVSKCGLTTKGRFFLFSVVRQASGPATRAAPAARGCRPHTWTWAGLGQCS